jgi:hypothetical protein
VRIRGAFRHDSSLCDLTVGQSLCDERGYLLLSGRKSEWSGRPTGGAASRSSRARGRTHFTVHLQEHTSNSDCLPLGPDSLKVFLPEDLSRARQVALDVKLGHWPDTRLSGIQKRLCHTKYTRGKAALVKLDEDAGESSQRLADTTLVSLFLK